MEVHHSGQEPSNVTIFVVVFWSNYGSIHIPCLWMVLAGCVFVAGIHPSRTWTCNTTSRPTHYWLSYSDPIYISNLVKVQDGCTGNLLNAGASKGSNLQSCLGLLMRHNWADLMVCLHCFGDIRDGERFSEPHVGEWPRRRVGLDRKIWIDQKDLDVEKDELKIKPRPCQHLWLEQDEKMSLSIEVA